MAVEFRELAADEPLSARVRDRVRAAAGARADDWSWLYRDNPAGSHAFVALDEGEVVAHCGVVARKVWAGGKERRFGELTDAFEARPGHLVLAAQGLAQAHGGPRELALFHDLATRDRIVLATRMLSFETVRSECVLRRELGGVAAEPAAAVVELERFGEDARWLWDRCSGEFGASAIRDAEYLNWRFVDRPGFEYGILGVYDDDRVLRGYAVLSRRESEERIVDWLVPLDELDVAEALMRAAVARSTGGGARTLATSLPPWSPWFDRFQRWGFLVHATGRALLARPFVRRYDDLWLRDVWWNTMADSIAD